MTLDIRWLAPPAIAAIAAAAPAASIAAQYMSIEQARMLIFAGADDFEAAPVSLTPEQVQRVQELSDTRVRSPQQQVWRVSASGKFAGWFILDQVIGKHELITYAVGINADGALRQFQIIEYREAYGSQIRYVNWRDQFVGKRIDSPLQLDVDIVNISGATLSCQHVTEGIRRLLALHAVALR
jgi:Na+-transporting NADH:ubiquinone oxidoreductase subunit C